MTPRRKHILAGIVCITFIISSLLILARQRVEKMRQREGAFKAIDLVVSSNDRAIQKLEGLVDRGEADWRTVIAIFSEDNRRIKQTKEVATFLCRGFKEAKDYEIRLSAMGALTDYYQYPVTIETVMGYIKELPVVIEDSERAVHEGKILLYALEILERGKVKEAVPILAGKLEEACAMDKSMQYPMFIPEIVAQTLAKIGDPRALPALEKAQKEYGCKFEDEIKMLEGE